MKLTWNLADKVLAELPKGTGQLDLHHTRPKIEGKEHGHTVFTLTPVSLRVHSPEDAAADLHDLVSVSEAGNFLELAYADGHQTRVHTGQHTAQIAGLIQGLLEPEDPLLASLSEKAESGDIRAMEQIADIYDHREDHQKAELWAQKASETRSRPHPKVTPEDREQQKQVHEAGKAYLQGEQDSVPDRLSAEDLWKASRGFAEVDDRVSEWKYLQRAAELSHPEAHYQMGAYLASGMHDLEADPEQAFAHMKTAAELGSRQAPYYLGSWYRTGTGTRKDLAEADRWLAQDDSVKALIQRMLVKEELQDRAGAESLAKEAMAKSTSQKTRDLLQKKLDTWSAPSEEPAYLAAAEEYNRKESASTPRQISAGDLMKMAEGYAQVNDFVQERRALEEAARLSHPEANYKLGAYLASGMHGNETDPKAAFGWMMHAADLGNDKAPYYLGMWYANGTGIEKDPEQAAFWLAKDKSPRAQMQLALVLKSLGREEEAVKTLEQIRDTATAQNTKDLAVRKLNQWETERQKEQEERQTRTRKALRIAHILNDAGAFDLAAEFLEEAAAGGSGEAKYLLALLLLKGQGVAADPGRARDLLEQAKETRPESLYYLTYLEQDPEKQKAYARAYLAQNPEKTRKEQVETLLGIRPAETGEKESVPETAEAPEKTESGTGGDSLSLDAAASEPEHAADGGQAVSQDRELQAVSEPEKPGAAQSVKPVSGEEDAAALRRRGIERISQGDENGTQDLQKAADLGDVDACLLLGEAMLQTEDPAGGIRYLRQAAAAGIGDAYALLGYACMNGLGVPADPRKAHWLIHQALRRGSRIARQWTLGD